MIRDSTHKPSQHVTRKVYTFVPTQDWTQLWTDQDLYAKYGITPSEIEFIEKVVRPMELTSDLLGDMAIDESEDE
jgi:site-specific DNA-methyltransferase (adenine-specific)